MSKRKPMDKTEARGRRNRLLESAAAAELSLTEGVREMRAIAGMTQEEFAEHRGVSARVIKAIELNQGNPTVATLNRIGEFFGLEVAFVPIRRPTHATSDPEKAVATELPAPIFPDNADARYSNVWSRQATPALSEVIKKTFNEAFKKNFQEALKRELYKALSAPDIQSQIFERLQNALSTSDKPVVPPSTEQAPTTTNVPVRKKKISGPS
jgi:transcriptional regulator with XRE-family HTH domain